MLANEARCILTTIAGCGRSGDAVDVRGSEEKVERRTSGGMDRSEIAQTRSVSDTRDAHGITITHLTCEHGPIMHIATKFALAGAGFVALRWSWRMGRFIYVAFTFQVEVPTQ